MRKTVVAALLLLLGFGATLVIGTPAQAASRKHVSRVTAYTYVIGDTGCAEALLEVKVTIPRGSRANYVIADFMKGDKWYGYADRHFKSGGPKKVTLKRCVSIGFANAEPKVTAYVYRGDGYLGEVSSVVRRGDTAC